MEAEDIYINEALIAQQKEAREIFYKEWEIFDKEIFQHTEAWRRADARGQNDPSVAPQDNPLCSAVDGTTTVAGEGFIQTQTQADDQRIEELDRTIYDFLEDSEGIGDLTYEPPRLSTATWRLFRKVVSWFTTTGDEKKEVVQEDRTIYDFLDDVEEADVAIATADSRWAYGPKHSTELRCSQIRWMRKTRNRYIPFKGKDSITIEIMYRELNGGSLNADEKRDYEQHLLEYKCHNLLESQNEAPKEKPEILVLDGYYKVNEDCKTISSVCLENCTFEIYRGVYITADNKPVESHIAEAIEKHLNDFIEHPDNSFDSKRDPKKPASLPLKEKPDDEAPNILIEWIDMNYLTIRRQGQKATQLYHYIEEADWNEIHPEISHLIFVIHGVGHDQLEHYIRENAESLSDGVEEIKKDSRFMFFPIHWRTQLELDGHKCTGKCLEAKLPIGAGLVGSVLPLDDAKLYCCKLHSSKIREIVIEQLNGIMEKLGTRKPNFLGSISIFGHSLGSVIGYDVMTGFHGKTEPYTCFLNFGVNRLFTVGSPLKMFLEQRGDEAEKRFVKALKDWDIYNVYHPMDKVAKCLSPFDGNFPKQELVVLNAEEPFNRMIIEYPLKLIDTVRGILWSSKDLEVAMPSEQSEGTLIIVDYALQANKRFSEVQPHSIYWEHKGIFRFLVYTILNENRFQIVTIGNNDGTATRQNLPPGGLAENVATPSYHNVEINYEEDRE